MNNALHVVIPGKEIYDIPSFYQVINRELMSEESWKIGTLDGLEDLLYGGLGRLKDYACLVIHWKDIAYSREGLGVETTLAYYRGKLQPDSPFNTQYFQQQVTDLEQGKGRTYFDIVLEIISGRPNVQLIAS